MRQGSIMPVEPLPLRDIHLPDPIGVLKKLAEENYGITEKG